MLTMMTMTMRRKSSNPRRRSSRLRRCRAFSPPSTPRLSPRRFHQLRGADAAATAAARESGSGRRAASARSVRNAGTVPAMHPALQEPPGEHHGPPQTRQWDVLLVLSPPLLFSLGANKRNSVSFAEGCSLLWHQVRDSCRGECIRHSSGLRTDPNSGGTPRVHFLSSSVALFYIKSPSWSPDTLKLLLLLTCDSCAASMLNDWWIFMLLLLEVAVAWNLLKFLQLVKPQKLKNLKIKNMQVLFIFTYLE